ncbi:hypothetical protein SM11_chr0440 [Sinorhizobium meliloti SM11]|uniref:Uncharacterized protein n=1 Tax=Sinorhizobium meliloti (strain SM11) TaxID=707241 RepID=F7X997_SINMM|nr:hypothetical protein SM11_chr0440 [Sinorhizobium meliloti SM11]
MIAALAQERMQRRNVPEARTRAVSRLVAALAAPAMIR